ncbi:MAG: protocatechuate 3,4-dioxygenase subunit alpha [Bryobacteraceae bacterium]
MSLIPTPSQTVGPFFNLALTTNPCLGILARDGAEGERILLAFRVLDGEGAPTPGDSMIELWQADARGRYAHALDPRSGEADPNFYGFGRLETDLNGRCVFETIRPGPVGDQAPHINVAVFARGLLKQLYTRVYFEGEAANAYDTVLALVPEERRATLMARPAAEQSNTWFVEIHLQGEKETVFFDV